MGGGGETNSTGTLSNHARNQVPVREREDSRLDDSIQFESSDEQVVVENDGIEKTATSCLRFFVLFLIVGSTIGAGFGTWNFLLSQEHADFQKEVSLVPFFFLLQSPTKL